jgi:hypothetical protein
LAENPWRRLRECPPYVLPEEEDRIRAFNAKVGRASGRYVEIDKVVPEAFVGSKDAPLILLSNNPGMSDWRLLANAEYYTPAFMSRMRENLLHAPCAYPFLFIAPENVQRGRKWLDRKLKCLLERHPREVLAKSVLNVTYFPYSSRRYGHSNLKLSSQEYSFSLVRSAVSGGAVVVLMRPGRERDWLGNVPELRGYSRFFKVSNPQNPTISPANLGRDFQVVTDAISAYAAKA